MTDTSIVKAELNAPAIAMIVSLGISLAGCLFGFMFVSDLQIYNDSQRFFVGAMKTLSIIGVAATAFSIYRAIQMMNARKHGFAMTSAIITMLIGGIIGIPIGIWVMTVLLKPEIKSAFAGNSTV